MQVRKTTIYVNASGKRRAAFQKVQQDRIDEDPDHMILNKSGKKIRPKPLKLIQDVSTRWDSTFYMLVRFFKLKDDIQTFLEEDGTNYLLLTPEQWSHIIYLIDITKEYAKITNAVSATKTVTIHYAFAIYSRLFTHLEKAAKQLRRKRVPWKTEMINALVAARDKLNVYYSKTKHSLGYFYGRAALLNPEVGDKIFMTSNWEAEEGEASWASQYWQSLEKEFDK